MPNHIYDRKLDFLVNSVIFMLYKRTKYL